MTIEGKCPWTVTTRWSNGSQLFTRYLSSNSKGSQCNYRRCKNDFFISHSLSSEDEKKNGFLKIHKKPNTHHLSLHKDVKENPIVFIMLVIEGSEKSVELSMKCTSKLATCPCLSLKTTLPRTQSSTHSLTLSLD